MLSRPLWQICVALVKPYGIMCKLPQSVINSCNPSGQNVIFFTDCGSMGTANRHHAGQVSGKTFLPANVCYKCVCMRSQAIVIVATSQGAMSLPAALINLVVCAGVICP